MTVIAPPPSEPIKPRVQPSRKGKKNWRRNVDIMDVEKNLDELREQEILGGKLYEKRDDDLFVVDKKGSEDVRKNEFRHKKLTIDQILTPPETGVKPISNRPVKRIAKKVPKADRKLSAHDQSKIQKLAKNKQAAATKIQPQTKGGDEGAYDIWSMKVPEEEPVDPISDYLAPVKPRKVKPPTTLKEPNVANIAAVKPSHPGTSYNPTFKDHQDLLTVAVEEELTRLEEKAKLEKTIFKPNAAEVPVPVNPPATDDSGSTDDEETESEIDDLEADGDVNASISEMRLTKAERNKRLRLQEEQRLLLKKKEEKNLLKQVDQLKNITKELDAKVKKQTTRQIQKKRKLEEKQQQPKKLSKLKFTPLPTQVQLTEELSESLRTLKPEGNLLSDRFLSLQERSIIEKRVPVGKKRRYPLKNFEKRSYKEFK